MVFNVVGGHQKCNLSGVTECRPGGPHIRLPPHLLRPAAGAPGVPQQLTHRHHATQHLRGVHRTGNMRENIYLPTEKYFTTEWSCILCNIVACGETAYVVLSKMALTVSVLF